MAWAAAVLAQLSKLLGSASTKLQGGNVALQHVSLRWEALQRGFSALQVDPAAPSGAAKRKSRLASPARLQKGLPTVDLT